MYWRQCVTDRSGLVENSDSGAGRRLSDAVATRVDAGVVKADAERVRAALLEHAEVEPGRQDGQTAHASHSVVAGRRRARPRDGVHPAAYRLLHRRVLPTNRGPIYKISYDNLRIISR